MLAVIVFRQIQVDARPTTKKIVLRQGKRVAITVDIRGFRIADAGTGAQKISFFERQRGRIRAAGAAVLQTRFDGPGVARCHFDVYESIVIRSGSNLYVIQKSVAPQQSLRLLYFLY